MDLGHPTLTLASPATVASGMSVTTFTYTDATVGMPTVTATWLAGGADLGPADHQIEIVAAGD